MQTRKVVTMMAGVAALSGAAVAGEVFVGPTPGPAPVAQDVEWSMKGKDTTSIRFNGRLQVQYDNLSSEVNGVSTETSNRFYFRRLFFGAKAKLSNGFFAETVYDFAGEDISLDKAFIGKKFDFLGGYTLKAGYTKVPFGFEETSSSAKIPTIERSAINRVFADDSDFSGRHLGLHAKLDLGYGFSIAGSAANAHQGDFSKASDGATDEMGYWGRIQWANDFLTVGADAGFTADANDSSTGGDQNAEGYTAYINYNQGGFNVLGEYFTGNPFGQSVNGATSGFAIRASYKLGKFEPVIRYTALEQDDANIDFDELIRRSNDSATGATELESLYVGVNYHYSKSVKFMLGYEDASAEDADGNEVNDTTGFRARLQLLF